MNVETAHPPRPRASYAVRIAAVLFPLLTAGGIAALVGSAVFACVSARHAAKSFTAAVREGRADDARALAATGLRPYLDADPSANPDSQALDFVRKSEDDSFAGFTGGFDDGCFVGDMDLRGGGSRPLYVLVVVEGGAWRVAGVRIVQPADQCDMSD